MEKVNNKLILAFLVGLTFMSCKQSEKTPIVLSYDFFCEDSLLPQKRVKIIQEADPVGDFSKITIINSSDSLLATFYQKISDNGISRSSDTANFQLSHAYKPDAEANIKWPHPVPYFLNELAKNHSIKSYSIQKNDSTKIIFFNEAIPWHSYTCSYYSLKDRLFLILYDCSIVDSQEYKMAHNCYYRLTKVEGLNIDNSYIQEITGKIISDTTFFSRYYKFPTTIPPSPVE